MPSGLTGYHAFMVTTTLPPGKSAGIDIGTQTAAVVVPIPTSQTFTLVLDADTNHIFVNDLVLSVTFDGRLFHADGFPIWDGQGTPAVSYEPIAFAIDGDKLHGTGHAKVWSSNGFEHQGTLIDLGDVPLEGVPDVTPVSFDMELPPPVDPFYLSDIVASKPLPLAHPFRFLGSAGDVVTYNPVATIKLAANRFRPPEIVLGYGETYRLDTQGFPDFAGLAIPALTFDTPPLPPVAAFDGFESRPAGAFGGGTIIDGTAGIPPAAGQKSWFVRPRFVPSAGAQTCATASSARPALRISMPAGSQFLTFTVVPVTNAPGPFTTATTLQFTFSVGVPGVSRQVGMPWGGAGMDKRDLPGGGSIYLGEPLVGVSVPVMNPLAHELTLNVDFPGICPQAGAPPEGLIIDDLGVL